MSEVTSAQSMPGHTPDPNVEACRCHADVVAREAQESEACRCHQDAERLVMPPINLPAPSEAGRRIPESAWQSGDVAVPAARVSQFRSVVGVIFLLPVLVMATGLIVSGFLPAVLAGLLLFLPALLPFALVGLGILCTGELQPTPQRRVAGHHSQEPAGNPAVASASR